MSNTQVRDLLDKLYASIKEATQYHLFSENSLDRFAADYERRFIEAAECGEIVLRNFQFDREKGTVTVDYDIVGAAVPHHIETIHYHGQEDALLQQAVFTAP